MNRKHRWPMRFLFTSQQKERAEHTSRRRLAFGWGVVVSWVLQRKVPVFLRQEHHHDTTIDGQKRTELSVTSQSQITATCCVDDGPGTSTRPASTTQLLHWWLIGGLVTRCTYVVDADCIYDAICMYTADIDYLFWNSRKQRQTACKKYWRLPIWPITGVEFADDISLNWRWHLSMCYFYASHKVLQMMRTLTTKVLT